jgi:hypothetical protein
MTRFEINRYINFTELFDDLFNDNEDDFIQHRHESDAYNRLLDFYRCYKNDYTLELEECTLSEFTVRWTFVTSNNDSNESNPDSTGSAYIIFYNFTLEEFTDCDYEA